MKESGLLFLSRSTVEPSLYFLAIMGLLASLLVARKVVVPLLQRGPIIDESLEMFGCVGLAAVGSAWLTGDYIDVLPVMAVFLAAVSLLRYTAARLTMPGVLWLASAFLLPITTGIWSSLFILESGMALWVRALSLCFVGLTSFIVLCGCIERIAREAVVTHGAWTRPMRAHATGGGRRGSQPRVSIHLPCYAEPPEVVMETMNRLAALDYTNFEVLVCDNNTKEEALWRPLEAHSARLNAKAGRELFRFFHVSPLPGAKAGALNFCLKVMDQSAELVAVIDADYLAKPDFLSRLVPFFEDPKLGYIQTPHDYRDYAGSSYLGGCYWEYMPNNKIDLPGISEYGGAITIGTMCILRKVGLDLAGGWAEWCLTEDSEVSVRMRQAGYEGIYLGETFGRGLIPETFDDYKKQRFRWTAGPVQQLRRHWRLFLPAPFAPRLSGWSKLLEILRCAAPLQSLFALVTGLVSIGALALGQVLGEREPLDLPNATWGLLAIGAVTWMVRTRHRYQLSGTARVADMLRGEIARMSLTYVVLLAGVAGLSSRPLAWRRTPKFALTSAEGAILDSTLIETILGGVFLVLAGLALFASDRLGIELAVLTAGVMGSLSFRFFCAPYMAMQALGHARALTDAPVDAGRQMPVPVVLGHGHAAVSESA